MARDCRDAATTDQQDSGPERANLKRMRLKSMFRFDQGSGESQHRRKGSPRRSIL